MPDNEDVKVNEDIKAEEDVKIEEDVETNDTVITPEEVEALRKAVENKQKFIQRQQSENDRLKAAIGKQGAPETVGGKEFKTPPDPENYTDEKKYFSDLIKFELANQNIGNIVQAELKNKQMYEKTVAQKLKFDQKVIEVQKKIPDFDEVARSSTMRQLYKEAQNDFGNIIEGLEEGPEIAYYLGKNIDEAYRLANLNGGELFNEIDILRKKTRAPKNKGISSISPPIEPVGGSEVSAGNIDMDKISMQEWLGLRNKNKKIP